MEGHKCMEFQVVEGSEGGMGTKLFGKIKGFDHLIERA
jgi:hypothetical protein